MHLYRSYTALTLSVALLGATGCGFIAHDVREPKPVPQFDLFGEGEAKPAETAKTAEPTPPAAPVKKANDGLYSVLWFQTSAEYDANMRGAYKLATIQLDRALAEKSWTAALEQVTTLDFADKPPAIIVDVDETVLDNSFYQARLVKDDKVFSNDSWNDWVREKRATPLPGALEFTRYAASKGVTVFYVTNRDSVVEAETRANLEALTFPMRADEDTLLTQGERADWASSDKSPRRAFIAQKYRILMLVGDNLGDFTGKEYKSSVAERDQLVTKYADWWGARWIMLPNPLYGSWESALYGHDHAKSEEEKTKARFNALITTPPTVNIQPAATPPASPNPAIKIAPQ